ncbi:MAG: helix-turn-helix transcriptional regulator [Pseudomonadota bacterium]
MANDPFAANLRLLCNQVPSIALLCRTIGVNRQQFSKYLAGTHRPSPYNLSRICRFFEIDEFELLLPPDQFERVVVRYRERPAPRPPSRLDRLIEATFPEDDAALARYEGYYHSHFRNFGTNDRIVRSLIRFYPEDGRMYVKTIERLATSARGQSYTMKYNGLVTLLGGRLHVVEGLDAVDTKLSLTILNPTYRSRITTLTGLTMSTATERDRLPAAARVVYRSLGKTIDRRAALSACGEFSPGSGGLGDDIVRLVQNNMTPDERALFGRIV